jgi:hypothetical protein
MPSRYSSLASPYVFIPFPIVGFRSLDRFSALFRSGACDNTREKNRSGTITKIQTTLYVRRIFMTSPFKSGADPLSSCCPQFGRCDGSRPLFKLKISTLPCRRQELFPTWEFDTCLNLKKGKNQSKLAWSETFPCLHNSCKVFTCRVRHARDASNRVLSFGTLVYY